MTAPEAPQAPAALSRFRPDFCPADRRRDVLLAAILASALGFIDGSVVAIALPAMRESLAADLVQATWFSNAYMVTLAALILTGGALGDRFGTARVFGWGIAGFVATSLACALAPSPELLIAARAAQGAAAAVMVPGSLAVIARAYPKDERGRAIGIWAAASALTTAAGPIVGGLVLTVGGPEVWRWIFAINLPLGAVAIWLLRRAVREDRGDPARGLDVAGAGLATLGLGAAAVALTQAEGDGARGVSLRPAAIAVAALAAFLIVEARNARPMLPLRLFRNRTFTGTNIVTLTLYFGLSAVLFFLPMLVIAGWGVSELAASAAFAPLTLFIAGLSSRFGAMADRRGPRLPLAAGCATVAVAYGWLALSLAERDFWVGVLPPMLLLGFGMSMVVAPLSAAVMGAVEEGDTGIASGVNNAVSRIAGLVAVAVMTTVAAAVYARAGGAASYGLPSDSPGHAEAMNAAFAAIAGTAAALSALSAVLAFLLLPRPSQTGS